MRQPSPQPSRRCRLRGDWQATSVILSPNPNPGTICRSEEDDPNNALNPYGDPKAWARKQGAVEQGALEVVCAGMHHMVRTFSAKWVHDAGMVCIGGLCKGRDKEGHSRRARARALMRKSMGR